jgi:hypothetical protein
MKDSYTHITLVVDRSGSMGSILTDAQGGINHFIDENKLVPEDCTFTLYQFDDQFEKVYSGDIQNIPAYVLYPRNSTALLDAQWRAINETGEFLAGMPEDERPSKVIFLTVTDGFENASTELVGPEGYARLKAKIEEQTHIYKWEFVYIGADQNAFAIGQSMGYANTTSYASTGASTHAMYANAADSVKTFRSKGVPMTVTLASSVDAGGNLTFNHDEEEDESISSV